MKVSLRWRISPEVLLMKYDSHQIVASGNEGYRRESHKLFWGIIWKIHWCSFVMPVFPIPSNPWDSMCFSKKSKKWQCWDQKVISIQWQSSNLAWVCLSILSQRQTIRGVRNRERLFLYYPSCSPEPVRSGLVLPSWVHDIKALMSGNVLPPFKLMHSRQNSSLQGPSNKTAIFSHSVKT